MNNRLGKPVEEPQGPLEATIEDRIEMKLDRLMYDRKVHYGTRWRDAIGGICDKAEACWCRSRLTKRLSHQAHEGYTQDVG